MIKKKKDRFTFKKEPKETGLSAVGHPYQSVNVKLNGKAVGIIHAPSWNSEGWRFMVMVNEPSNQNCPWSWRRIKTFTTELESRLWVLENADLLLKMNLRWDEDE